MKLHQCVGKCPVWWHMLSPGSQVTFSTMIEALKLQAAAGVDQGFPLLHAKVRDKTWAVSPAQDGATPLSVYMRIKAHSAYMENAWYTAGAQ